MNQAKIDYTFNMIAYHRPFFLHALSLLPIVEEESSLPAYGSWDGHTIRMYTPVSTGLPKEQYGGVIYHELCHAIYFHLERMGLRNIRLWNVACDYKINGEIFQETGYGLSLPPGVLYDKRYVSPDLDCEEIYALLEKSPEGKQIIEDYENGVPSTIQGQEYSGEFENIQDLKDASEKSEDIVRQSIQLFGDSAETLGIRVQEILRPTVDWRKYLKKFVSSFRSDYNFSRGDKHYPEVFLPDFDMIEEQKMDIAIALDMSGSIGERERMKFLGEVQSITEKFPLVNIQVYCFDTSVYYIGEIKSVSDVEKRFGSLVGGGGTSFVDLIALCTKNRVKGLVVFTDLYGKFPKKKPQYPVMWADVDWKAEKKVPWGQVIKCELV